MDPEEEELAVFDEIATPFFDEAVGGADGGGNFQMAGGVGEAILYQLAITN